jgi:hypothetical protein
VNDLECQNDSERSHRYWHSTGDSVHLARLHDVDSPDVITSVIDDIQVKNTCIGGQIDEER